MDVGRLNKRITFVQMVDKENSLGQLVKVQEPVKTVWATVSSTKGKEQQEANKIRPELNYDIYTRYFPWITSDMLIKYNGKILEMVAPPADKDEKHEYLYIRCTEYQKKDDANMSIEMKVEGCEELERDLRTAIHKFPDTAERELKKNANALKRAARENMNSKIKHHRDNLIDQSWRTKQVEEGVSATIMVFNKAPHSHLVEIGHEEYDFHGNPTGRWVEGNHALEETTGEFEKEMPERYEKMIENLLGGNNL